MEHKKPKLKTGIAGLDEMLYGGLVADRPYIISGLPGSGKTTFGIQFLLQGIREKENVLFVAVDEPPNEIKLNYSSFDWNMANLKILDANSDIRRLEPTPILDITSKSFVQNLCEIPDTIRKTPDFESVIVTIHSLQQTIKQILDRGKYERLVIDSMTGLKYFCMEGLDENTSIQSFIRFLAELKVTTLLTLETTDEPGLTPELFLSRGEIRLHKWWSNGTLHRGISVEVIRGTRHDEALRPMEITKKGIVVYPEVSEWRRKTSERAKRLTKDEEKALETETMAMEKAIEDTIAEPGGIQIDLSHIQATLSSAKQHMESGNSLYAQEITLYCRKMLDDKIAMRDAIKWIMSVEGLLLECKKSHVMIPEADELLKKAKLCVNSNSYRDALRYAQECDAQIKARIDGESTAEKAAETAAQPAAPHEVTPEKLLVDRDEPGEHKKTEPSLPETAPKEKETVPPPPKHPPPAESPAPPPVHPHAHAAHQSPPAPPPPPTPPPPPGAPGAKHCPICHKELKFIQQYSRWYCFQCKKYAPKNI